MKKEISLGLVLTFLISGCSTMYNSGSQSIRVFGKEGTKVLVTTPDGTYDSKLPTTVVAEPGWEDVTVKVDDGKYEPSSNKVGKSITPSFWANILNGGLGMLVDLGTGKLWKYDNNIQVQVTEKKK